MATGEREPGMSIAVIPSLCMVHYIFSAVFLKTKPFIKFTLPLLTIIVSIIGLKYVLPLEINP